MNRLNLCVIVLMCSSMAHAVTNQYSGTLPVGIDDSYDNTYLWNEAELDMDGGTLRSLDMFNSSTANISDGTITQDLYAWTNSTVDISGGTIGWSLEASDSSTVNLHGGIITDYLYATDSSVVNVIGYGFNYDPTAGNWNGGQLTGFWLDDTPFEIDLLDNITVDSTYYDHINLVPEPATLLLLSLGGVLIRRMK